jgi:hypothetical protein
VISRAGADTINGVTSVTIASANGAYLLKSDGIVEMDGSSAWRGGGRRRIERNLWNRPVGRHNHHVRHMRRQPDDGDQQSGR